MSEQSYEAGQKYYSREHEWVEKREDGYLYVGVSLHAVDMLGDIVFLELPAIGDELQVGQSCAVIESTKAASEIYAPALGCVVAVNDNLLDNPGLVNSSTLQDGWLFALENDNIQRSETLMSADEYERYVSGL